VILLVEDNPMNANMLSRRLIRRGWRVIFAEDGRAAIDAAIERLPRLILMDLSLPEIDGWTATRILKDDRRTSHIPIVVLTAHAMAADRDRAYEAGCDAFETKPVDFARLSDVMESLIGPPGPKGNNLQGKGNDLREKQEMRSTSDC
jgi:CheY-like chemotaxis protein